MDIVFIKGLVIPSIIGVYTWERSCFQKLIFDVEVGYTRMGICSSTNLNDYYLDYQKVSNCIRFLVAKKNFFLLESVAEDVAMEVLLKFNVIWVRVKINKIGAIAKGVESGVVIERGVRDVVIDNPEIFI